METTGRADGGPTGEAGWRLDPDAAARLLPHGEQSVALARLTALASQLLSTPDAPLAVQVSLLTDVQSIVAGARLPEGSIGSQGPLADSLCTLTAVSGSPLEVSDGVADLRVSHLPAVTSGDVVAYLGVPLRHSQGRVIGALCAFGPLPRTWSAYDLALLEELGGAVLAQLELQALTAEFQTSRLQWDVAIEAAGIGTFDWDLRTGRLDWDSRLQALFGYAPGEHEPRAEHRFKRVHADDRPAFEAAVAAAVAESGTYHTEFRVVWPDGQQRWVAARGRAIAGEDGKPGRLLGTAHDITEARTARDEAARLLETMATGFLAVNRDWQVTYLNSEGARVVGMRAEDLIGQIIWDAFPGLVERDFGRQYQKAMATGESLLVEAYYEHLDGWFEVRVVPSPEGLAMYFLEVTGRHKDQMRAEAATNRLELLASVSAELAAAGLDTEGAVARLAQMVVPVLADWCVVSLAIEPGRITDVGCWHHDPELREVVEQYVAERLIRRSDLGAVQQAGETREPVVIDHGVVDMVMPTLGSDVARQALTRLNPESLVVVPLTARGNMTAVLSLVRGPDRPPMSDDEITTVREIASRAALTLDNARLYAEQRGLAEGLQRSLLTTPPEPDHCQIVVRYVPAAEEASVGGDWFDSFLQADGATVLVIGDVMGHDTVAAAAMGQVRSLLRGIAWHTGAAPAEVLSGLDAAMRGLQVNTTATAVVARIEQSEDERGRGITRLRWSNAGHPPPMAINPDGSVIALAGVDADLLLGIDPDSPRNESAIVLDRDSTVLLYTDGLVERRGQDLDEGLALLRDTLGELGNLPLDELCDELLVRMLPEDAEDDVALIAVRLHRQDEPRPPEAGPVQVPPGVPDEPDEPDEA